MLVPSVQSFESETGFLLTGGRKMTPSSTKAHAPFVWLYGTENHS